MIQKTNAAYFTPTPVDMKNSRSSNTPHFFSILLWKCKVLLCSPCSSPHVYFFIRYNLWWRHQYRLLIFILHPAAVSVWGIHVSEWWWRNWLSHIYKTCFCGKWHGKETDIATPDELFWVSSHYLNSSVMEPVDVLFPDTQLAALTANQNNLVKQHLQTI
jgi:hypothetical protein